MFQGAWMSNIVLWLLTEIDKQTFVDIPSVLGIKQNMPDDYIRAVCPTEEEPCVLCTASVCTNFVVLLLWSNCKIRTDMIITVVIFLQVSTLTLI